MGVRERVKPDANNKTGFPIGVDSGSRQQDSGAPCCRVLDLLVQKGFRTHGFSERYTRVATCVTLLCTIEDMTATLSIATCASVIIECARK